MYRSFKIGLVAAAALVTPAFAQPPTAPICAALSDEVLRSEWRLSEIQLGAIGDNSAPRASMRADETTAELKAISVAFEQMRDNRCPAYPHPISRRSFEAGAYACSKAISTTAEAQVAGKPADPAAVRAACDKTAWTRSTK